MKLKVEELRNYLKSDGAKNTSLIANTDFVTESAEFARYP